MTRGAPRAPVVEPRSVIVILNCYMNGANPYERVWLGRSEAELLFKRKLAFPCTPENLAKYGPLEPRSPGSTYRPAGAPAEPSQEDGTAEAETAAESVPAPAFPVVDLAAMMAEEDAPPDDVVDLAAVMDEDDESDGGKVVDLASVVGD